MTLKKMNVQISVFLKDGIMNPSRYKQNINGIFENLFDKEILSINIEGAPDNMPLVKCASKNNTIAYEFARKRINFFMNFNIKNSIISFDEYKNMVLELITDQLISVTAISRIGIAFVYYYDVDDRDNKFWIEKYNFPFISESTSELSYTINNIFQKQNITFNNVISLSNTSLNGKNVPIVSVDLNNIPIDALTEEQIKYILTKCSNYNLDTVSKLLSTDDK